MKISELYRQKKPVVSLEIFPPKKEKGPESIYTTLEALERLRPDFISVTYSAGGSGNHEITLQIASLIKNRYGIEALPHLTCLHADPGGIQGILDQFAQHKLENIMALRGDVPPGGTEEEFAGGHYRFAKDLICQVKREYPALCIGAAAYPEGHIACENLELDIAHLRQKQEAGASFLVTQLFFDNGCFYRFYDKARAAGVTLPISAGVMPILSRGQIQKMIFMCGASLPSRIIRILNRYENDPEGLVQAGIEYSAEQLRDLVEHGVDGIHIYTMNRPEIAVGNLAKLGLAR